MATTPEAMKPLTLGEWRRSVDEGCAAARTVKDEMRGNLLRMIEAHEPLFPGVHGYELAIGIEIFRGRYYKSFAEPAPLKAGKVEKFKFALPHVDHVFLPGHRIMVQVQSSLFPLYDRNPQTYVENIMFAKPADYKKATQSVWFGGATASAVTLPVVE